MVRFARSKPGFAAALLIWMFSHPDVILHAQSAGDSRDMVKRSNDLSDLSTLAPYHLRATVISNPGSPQEQQGELTLDRDKDRFRWELHLGDYHELKIVKDNKISVSRSQRFPLAGLEQLENPEMIWHLGALFSPHTKFSKFSEEQVGGVQTRCFHSRLPNFSSKIELCFDVATGAVVRAHDNQGWTGIFSDYTQVGAHFFPRTIRLTQPHAPKNLEIRDIELVQTVMPVRFDPPAGARQFDTCGDVTSPWLLGPTDWQVSDRPEAYLYGVVDESGKLHDAQIHDSRPGAYKNLNKLLRNLRFLPAKCGGNAIAYEINLPLQRVSILSNTNSGYDPGFLRNSDGSCQMIGQCGSAK